MNTNCKTSFTVVANQSGQRQVTTESMSAPWNYMLTALMPFRAGATALLSMGPASKYGGHPGTLDDWMMSTHVCHVNKCSPPYLHLDDWHERICDSQQLLHLWATLRDGITHKKGEQF